MTSARSCNLFPALHRFVMSGGTIDVGRIDVMDCGSVNKSSDNRGDSHETCNEVPPNLGPHAPGAAKIALRSGIVTPFIHAEELVAPTPALPTRDARRPAAPV